MAVRFRNTNYDPNGPFDPNFQNVYDDTQPGEAPRDESGGYATPYSGHLDVYGNPATPTAPTTTTSPTNTETRPGTPQPTVISDEDYAKQQAEYARRSQLVQPGTGLYEGPKNEWGMDASTPQLEGFPQWDTATSLKYRFGREVAKYAPTMENAQKVIQDAIGAGWDIRADDKDPSMFWFNNPELGTWEAVRLLSGNNTWQFNWGSDATGGNSGAGAADTGTGIGVFQPASPAPTTGYSDIPWAPQAAPYTPPTTTPTAGQDANIQSAMRDALLKILQQPEVNAESLQNDPAVRAQRIQAQRAEERQRAQLVEQNAIEGLADSGAEQTDLAGIRQQRSESEAAFIGQLAIQQMELRRAEIMQGIQIATQQGQFEAGQALSRELAQLDAAIRREQIAATLRDNAASRDLSAMLQANQLSQQQKQFLLSLGFNYDELEVRANQAAAQWATGG